MNTFILAVTIIATLGTTATPTSSSYMLYFRDLAACEEARATVLEGVFVRAPNTNTTKIPAVYAAYQAECHAKATVE